MVTKNWSPELEGLRGIAALWVLLGHIAILVGFQFPILSEPHFGVDLFILLSGYLMTHNYLLRRDKEPWEKPSTILTFWMRRFFRIAPLYYMLLIVALLLGPWIGTWRDIIAVHLPQTDTTDARYNDQSIFNALTHFSFLFGLSPYYSFSTALPDWSIGLEMQYYALFPFLMLLIYKLRFSIVFVLVGLIMFSVAKFIAPEYIKSFEMPAMILLKINTFIAGMAIAFSVAKKKLFYSLIAVLSTFLILGIDPDYSKRKLLGELILTLGFAILMWPGKIVFFHRIIESGRKFLSWRPVTFFGDVSYSVYLVHLLVIIPLIGYGFLELSMMNILPIFRFFIITTASLLICYPMGYLLFKFIEKPGIKFGKSIISRSMATTQPVKT